MHRDHIDFTRILLVHCSHEEEVGSQRCAQSTTFVNDGIQSTLRAIDGIQSQVVESFTGAFGLRKQLLRAVLSTKHSIFRCGPLALTSVHMNNNSAPR
jgi:hypothetical protein